MSANLLQNPGKIHTFTDDLESFLHVLGWMTLRYVPASDAYDAEDCRKDMAMFDELSARRGRSDRGGDSKSDILGVGKYPSRRFRPRKSTPIFKLIRELSTPFRWLYAEPLTEEDHDILSNSTLDTRYSDRAIQQLQCSSWFMNKTKKALDEEVWPHDDKADETLPISLSSGDTVTDARMLIKTSQLQNTHSV